MALRPPSGFADLHRLVSGQDALEAELLAEKASALGRSGRAVETALEAYRAAEDGPAKRALAYRAAEAVQAHLIQRELMGMRRHEEAIARLQVAKDVLAKIGARPDPGETGDD